MIFQFLLETKWSGFFLKGKVDRTIIDEYLPQLHSRGSYIKKDLEAFDRVIREIEVSGNSELKQRRLELLERISVSFVIFEWIFCFDFKNNFYSIEKCKRYWKFIKKYVSDVILKNWKKYFFLLFCFYLNLIFKQPINIYLNRIKLFESF